MLTFKLKKHIFYLAHIFDVELTNQQFNKLLFFTVGMTISKLDKNSQEFRYVYNNYNGIFKFSRWRYGAMVEYLYEMHCHYGSRPINLKSYNSNKNILDEGKYNYDLSMFDANIIKLFKADSVKMIQLNINLPHHRIYADDIEMKLKVPDIELDEIYNDFKNIRR